MTYPKRVLIALDQLFAVVTVLAGMVVLGFGAWVGTVGTVGNGAVK